MYPFCIILTCVVEQPEVVPLRVKLDPGSKTTGIAIVNDASGEVVFAAELSHRGKPSRLLLMIVGPPGVRVVNGLCCKNENSPVIICHTSFATRGKR
jgi:hypothetical protein